MRKSEVAQRMDVLYNPFGNENEAIVPVVCIGEIKSMAIRSNWGVQKLMKLDEVLGLLLIADINSKDVLERYAEIDAYSQGKYEFNKSKFSSRNMGKNDLWIAAITSVLHATLITCDNDFNHLSEEYLNIIKIEV
ncbi:MAG: hypothetical protein K1X55_03465 [Chitinophagales bacterium]|nr:hypothetical protein [Chitinophagales bacterium]